MGPMADKSLPPSIKSLYIFAWCFKRYSTIYSLIFRSHFLLAYNGIRFDLPFINQLFIKLVVIQKWVIFTFKPFQ